MTRKLIIHDGRAERELVLVASITVGRDPSCHISDLDPLLSRRHAEFVTTVSGCTVRDLGSRNGMLVNGIKVREQRLKEGDLIQLGHLQLRYVEDAVLETPEAHAMSHATTAHESATMASPAARLADLEDTKPHPPHAHAGHDDADVTRLPDEDAAVTRLPVRPVNEEPTMAPRAAAAGSTTSPADDTDPTMAPIGHSTSSDAETAPAPASFADGDATFVAGRGLPPTTPTASDPDATFVAGAMLTPPAGLSDVDATMASMKKAMSNIDLDRTIAPGSLGLDATFVAGIPPAHVTARATPPAPSAEARVTVGADLKIATATPGCHALFGVAPEALVGRVLGDVLTERMHAASDAGPSALTFVVERSPSDRSLIVTLKTAQAIETVS